MFQLGVLIIKKLNYIKKKEANIKPIVRKNQAKVTKFPFEKGGTKTLPSSNFKFDI
jgi:hypothetical protein